MSEIQSVQSMPVEALAHQVKNTPVTGEYAKVEQALEKENVPHVDKEQASISHGVPNAYAGEVQSALMKVCGPEHAVDMDTLMKMVQKDPSKRVSEILMEMLDQAKTSSSNQTSHGAGETNPALMNLPMVTPVHGQALYPVPDGTPEAWVAPEWSADAVSDRIMQLAGFFMATLPGDPEENMKKIKEAMEKGFQNANDSIGAVPADLAQLYNNTYTQTMDKWDQFVKEFRSEHAQKEMSGAFQTELEKGEWTRPVGI